MSDYPLGSVEAFVLAVEEREYRLRFQERMEALARAVGAEEELRVALDTSGVSGATDLRNIIVSYPRSIQRALGVNEREAVAIAVYILVHEAAHVRWTSDLRVIVTDIQEKARDIGARPEVLKFLLNLLEDYRVDHKMMEERPGYRDLLRGALPHFARNSEGSTDPQVATIRQLLFEAYREYYGTVPSLIPDAERPKVRSLADKYKGLALTAPDTETVLELAADLYKELFDEEKGDDSGDGEGEGSQEDQEHSEDSPDSSDDAGERGSRPQSGDNDDGQGEEKREREEGGKSSKDSKDDGSDNDNDGDQNGDYEEEESDEGGSDLLKDSSPLDILRKEVRDKIIHEASREEANKEELESTTKSVRSVWPEILEGEGYTRDKETEKVLSKREHEGVHVYVKSFDKDEVDNVYKIPRIDRLDRTAQNLSKELSDVLRKAAERDIVPRRSGSLIANRVWRVGSLRDPNVFARLRHDTPGGWAVLLLLDGSGSMYFSTEQMQQAAYVTAKALESIPQMKVRMEVFRACEEGVVRDILKDWDTPQTAYNGAFFYRAQMDNRDGYSIRIASRELMKRPEPNKLLVVFSDGRPLNGVSVRLRTLHYVYAVQYGQRPGPAEIGHYVDEFAIGDTKKAIREARAQHPVMGVYFGEDPEKHRELFGADFAHIRDLDSMPRRIVDRIARVIRET